MPGTAAEISGNIFMDVARELQDEQIVNLLAAPNVRIERIVSTGQASPPDFWYDQEWAEWIVLLAGSAGLFFQGETDPLLLEPGSFVHIAAHRRHRVAWTDKKSPTIWLAIHYQ
jgi:cupin 2 domain-containing protein